MKRIAILAVLMMVCGSGCLSTKEKEDSIISCPEEKKPDGEFYYPATKHGYECCDGFIEFSNSDVQQEVKIDSCDEEVWVIHKDYPIIRREVTYQVNRKDLFLYSDADIYKPFRDKILKRQEENK